MAKRTLTAEDVTNRAIDLFWTSTVEERKQGETWYDRANAYARDKADELDTSVSRVAAVLAITSINTTWKANQTLTDKHLRTGWIGGLPAVRAQLAQGTPKGRKVENFAKAIEGDERAVVVDRWMFRAFGASNSDGAYSVIEQGITDAADRLGISPRALQATIWVLVRGRDN